ncbi:aspartic peptidase domain-containing protein [Halenospora varia]|nr:aspartic peptidase domain-containing protein [Halenospora varia]
MLIDPAIRHNAVLYDPYVSSTAGQVVGYSFAQSYGTGALSMSGPVVQDNVKVGNLVIAKFMFECVNKTSKELGVAGEPSHGGWGMNLDPNGMNTRPNRISSWFPAIMNYLNSQVFCIDWNRATDTGTIDFGYADPAKYTGAMAYTPVEPGSQLWIFPISGIAIGTTFFRGEFRVMMDTGDPGWGFKIPRWAVDEYFKALFPGKGLDSLVWNEQHSTYQIPCATQLIDIVWGVGLEEKRGIGWKDLKKYYIQGVSTEWCLCDVSSEHGMDNGKEIYHWPQWVQKRNYMVYDYGNRRVGFGGKDY